MSLFEKAIFVENERTLTTALRVVSAIELFGTFVVRLKATAVAAFGVLSDFANENQSLFRVRLPRPAPAEFTITNSR